MNTGTTVLLCIVAGAAAGIAVVAGTNLPVVVPAAAVAVGAASLLLVGVVERVRWPATGPVSSAPGDVGRVRASMSSGAWGRADLVALLDHLDRSEAGKLLPSTSREEIARLQRLSREEFREYLRVRVSDLERRT